MEVRYLSLMKILVERVDIEVFKLEVFFRNVVDEVFFDGVIWGRIVVVVCFVFEVVVFCS